MKINRYKLLSVGACIFVSWVSTHVSNCASAACLPPPSGLIGWWKAEDNVLDSVGTNDGGFYGGTTFADGFAGRAFAFDGATSSITNGLAGYTNVLDSYTMEFWAYPTADRVSTTETTEGLSGNGGQRYAIYPNHGGFGPLSGPNVGAGVSVGTNGISVFEHTGNYLPSLLVYDAPIIGWTHIAVVYTNRQPRLYVNGTLVRVGLTSTRSSYPSTWLGEAGPISGNYGYYAGWLDEVSIYDRPLSNAEILALYNAGTVGKCSVAPVITVSPTNQTVPNGGTVVLSAEAKGTRPLTFTWQLEGVPIPGATDSTYTILNAQTNQSGNYALVASNDEGSVTSAPALVNIYGTTGCAATPPGIVSWWKGDDDFSDNIGPNPAADSLGVSFAPAMAGDGFFFNGSGPVLQLGSASSLWLQDLTVEGWIQRASDTAVSLDGGGNGHIFAFDSGGYTLFLDPSGRLAFGRTGLDDVRSVTTITDTGVHHVAVTKSGSTVTFYIDGNPEAAQFYNGTFSFGYPAYIGGIGNDYNFYGTIDELAIFNRPLTDQDILSIFQAGALGKCPVPPRITADPADQSTYLGKSATFVSSATGSKPLQFQWQFEGQDIPGATGPTYTLTDAQFSDAGHYRVVVANAAIAVTSAPAVLQVLAIPPCNSAPSNIISWWKAEGNFTDNSGGNNGTNSLGVTFETGMAGSAFSFNGAGAVVSLGSPPNLRFQDFTIEAWIRRATNTVVSLDGIGNGHIFAFDAGGYTMFLDSAGHLALGATGISDVRSTATIRDTGYHHVAVTKSGTSVIFYIDGVAQPPLSFTRTFAYGTRAYIGGIGNNYNFYGNIDELAIYNRPLIAQEVQTIYSAGPGGKCDVAATLAQQPQSQTVNPGVNVTFTAVPIGTPPLSFGWRFNGVPLASAAATSLTITNVQANQAGAYSFGVTNGLGYALSSNALLKVQFLWAYANGARITNSFLNFSGSVSIQLTNLYTNGLMFYTLDGSAPTFDSAEYSGPFVVSNTSLLRVLGYSSDFMESGEMDPVYLNLVPAYQLTATTPGGGTLAFSPPGGSYMSNAVVNVTATASNGWTFLRWLGDASGTNPVTTVTMDSNKRVKALFGTALGATVAGGGSLILSPTNSLYPYGTTVGITAVPQPGNYFAIWGNAASGNANPLYFTVTNPNSTVSSLFSSLSAGQVSLAVIPAGFGRVTVSPKANSYSAGANVSLTAVPDPGQRFVNWTGDASGTSPTLNLSMNSSKVITANFTRGSVVSITNVLDGITENGLRLSVTGELGAVYRLEYSSNLASWVTLATVTNSAGVFQIVDPAFTNRITRFYRAVTP